MKRSIAQGAKVAAVAVALSAAAGACGSSSAPTTPAATSSAGAPAATATVKIVNFMFQPMAVTIKAGGTVRWVQVDSVGHSVQSDTGAWPTSAVLMPGQTFSHTFPRAGTYSYICGVHTYMHGTVKVVG